MNSSLQNRYASEHTLDYCQVRMTPQPGVVLELDDRYRRNQLPLLNPDHPACLPAVEETYLKGPGTYQNPRISVVAFCDIACFESSPVFQQLVSELRSAAAAPKIDWAMFERRQHLMHITIASGLEKMPDYTAVLDQLEARGPARFSALAKGPFISTYGNFGRMYLPVFPQMFSPDENHIQHLQAQITGTANRFYAAGLFNLSDSLTETETHELLTILEASFHTPMFEMQIDTLSVISTHDDLILNSREIRRLGLSIQPASFRAI